MARQTDPWAAVIDFSEPEPQQQDAPTQGRQDDSYANVVDFPQDGNMQEGVTSAYGQTAPGYDDSKMVAESPYTAVDGSRTARADEDVYFNDQGLPVRGYRWSADQKGAFGQAVADGDHGQAEMLWAKFAGVPVSDIPPRVRQMITTAIEENRKHPGIGLNWLDGEVDQSAEQDRLKYKYGKYADIDPRELMDERNWFPEGVDATTRGGAMGFGDEIDGVRNGGWNGLTKGDWHTFEDEYQRAGRVGEYQEQEHPYLTAAGNFAGSLLLPTKVTKMGAPAARAAYLDARAAGAGTAAARSLAVRAAQGAIRRQLVKEGAFYGGGMGAASADGDPVERAIGGAEGAAVGGLGGEVVGRMGTTGRNVKEALFPASRGPTEAGQFARAAERQNVEYLPADLPNAGGSRVLSAVANSGLGAPMMTQGAERTIGSLDNAVGRVASNIGNVAPDEAGAGQAIQRGLRSTQDAMESTTTRFYDAIPINPSSDAQLGNTRKVLADITAGFQSNPALSKVWADNPRLKATLDALKGKLSWEDLKALRSNVGSEIGQPSLLSSGPERAQLRALYGALSEDMRATAESGGSQALRAFERANTYARASRARLENIFKPLLGDDLNISPEKAMATLQGWAKSKNGDFAKLAQALRSLPPEEAGTVRATVLDTMGRAAPGVQNRAGDVFSPATFMTNWNKLSERAQNTLFGGEHAQSVRDIVRLAEGMKASAKYANTSRTALSNNVAQSLGLSGGVGVGLATNPVAGALAIAGQVGLGKLMSEPAVAKWMARLANKPNRNAVLAHVKRLASVARAVPALADDLYDYQNKLEQLFKVDTNKREDNAEAR